jgi:hypothetical protein
MKKYDTPSRKPTGTVLLLEVFVENGGDVEVVKTNLEDTASEYGFGMVLRETMVTNKAQEVRQIMEDRANDNQELI